MRYPEEEGVDPVLFLLKLALLTIFILAGYPLWKHVYLFWKDVLEGCAILLR